MGRGVLVTAHSGHVVVRAADCKSIVQAAPPVPAGQAHPGIEVLCVEPNQVAALCRGGQKGLWPLEPI